MANGPWGAGSVEPFRINITWSVQGNRCMTGFYLKPADGNPFVGNMIDVVNNVVANFMTPFRALLLQTDQIISISALNIVTGVAAEVTPSNQFGTISGTAAAPNFLMVPVSFKSGLRRKYGQGRGLWPVRAEVHTDADVLTDVGAALFQTAIDALKGTYVNAGVGQVFALINIHDALPAGRPNNTKPSVPAVPATQYEVQNIVLKRALSSLKRRKIGVGS